MTSKSLSKRGKLKFQVVVRKNDYDLKILCCGKPLKGTLDEYRFAELRKAKCSKCGRKIEFDRFFQEAHRPTKEERKDPFCGEAVPQSVTFNLEVTE